MLSGCITEATVELTKAPFDATTALTDGTSKAVGELLEPTKKFVSSTTPGAAAIDRFTRAREKTELFVGYMNTCGQKAPEDPVNTSLLSLSWQEFLRIAALNFR